ncbi:MAG TPA: histidine kinase [Saprospiraceae bacterium]|nr:histidine kinase [Saprospiraceae bacterium]
MKRSRKLTPEQWMRFAVVPLIAAAHYLSMLFTSPKVDYDYYVYEAPWYIPAITYLSTLLGIALNVELNIAIARRLDSRLTWEQRPFLRIVVQLSMLCLVIVVLSLLISVIFLSIMPLPDPFEVNLFSSRQLRTITFAILLSIITGGIYLALSFFQHLKTTRQEAEHYKITAAQAQIEALKAQLDPHFMFNSLNTLTELVEIDSSKSLDFLKSFGKVYRYVLQTREHESVTLQEELDFADSYLFLLKTRFGEALQVEKNVADADLEKHLPPMTLQLLLENAVKHNVLTASKPLLVRLSSDGQWLSVQNNLQLKSSKPYSSGIGLKNITERVLRLTEKEPIIENSDGVFVVKIPLQ